jgi:8-oxo-dGTP diphosphatase
MAQTDKTTTLLLIRRGDEILLAMKKRGFGSGRWNGVGGKVDPGETIEQAVVRECQEEIGVTPTEYHKVAEHDFILNSQTPDEWHMYTHTYLCSQWEGEPVETEEMAPQWFKVSDMPYSAMWQDDRYWMPQVLEGKLLKTLFTFDTDDNLLEQTVEEVGTL